MDMLGVELNPAYRCTRLTDTRYWRLERGIDAALRRRRLSGRAVEAILGHCTFAGLLNRASLSIFHASYKFIRLHYDVPTALWESVRGELQAFRDILPMIEADWTLPWNPHVTVTDASNSGFGECTGVWDARVVAQHGRLQERSRFRRGAVSARAHALTHLEDLEKDKSGRLVVPADGDEPGSGSWAVDDSFVEIPAGLLEPKDYRLTRRGVWTFDEDIHLQEARALVGALERHSRTPSRVR